MHPPVSLCSCTGHYGDQNLYNSEGSSRYSSGFTGYHREASDSGGQYTYYVPQYADSNSSNSPYQPSSAEPSPSSYCRPLFSVHPYTLPTPLATSFENMTIEPGYDQRPSFSATYGDVSGTLYIPDYMERSIAIPPGLTYSPSVVAYHFSEEYSIADSHEGDFNAHPDGTETPAPADNNDPISELQVLSEMHPDDPLPVENCEQLLEAVPLPATTSGTGSRGGMKEYICRWPNCNVRVTRHDHAVAHIATHVNHKPFKCGKCDRRFLRPHDYERHIKKCSKRRKSGSRSLSGSGKSGSGSPDSGYPVGASMLRSCSTVLLVTCRSVTWFKSIFR